MDPTRRRFLSIVAGAAATLSIQETMRRALAVPAHSPTGSIRDVEHIVVLMQENRSFDHYFGTLRGVRGFDDPRAISLPGGGSVFAQPDAATGRTVLPFRLDTHATAASCMKSLDHSWKGSETAWQHWDAWIARKTPLTMGHLTRDDIPYYYALADAFTVCDAYHASIFGPTEPNRLYLFTGTNGLAVGNDGRQATANFDDGNWSASMARDKPDFPAFGWTTYADRLIEAGIGFRVYQEVDNFGDNPLALFRQFRNLDPASPRYQAVRAIVPGSTEANAKATTAQSLVDAFAHDVSAGTLPQVSILVAPTAFSEHPDAPPEFGETLIARLMEVLVAHPEVWSRTVFLLNYDENDGFFDHVPPPVPALVAGAGHSAVSVAGEDYHGVPVGLGPRVPMLAISPWSKGGWTCSQIFDHTSVIRFIEARFGVHEPNITPWRRAVCGDLTSLFDFSHAPAAFDARLPSTAGLIPETIAACHLPKAAPPAMQSMPVQEAGQRPARPLPYRLGASIVPTGQGLSLRLVNDGSVAAPFILRGSGGVVPLHYLVEAGGTHEALLAAPAPDTELSLHGPNGFLRRRVGTGLLAVSQTDDATQGRVVLDLHNLGSSPLRVTVASAYHGADATRTHLVAASGHVRCSWSVAGSDHWYDLTVTAPGLVVQSAGHLETGRPSRSDPAIGARIA